MAPSAPAVGAWREEWRDAWRDGRFRIRFLFTAPALVAALAALARFLEWNDARPGVVLPDPVLALLPPRDLTWLTFGLVYLGIAAGVTRLARDPRAFAAALGAYAVLVGFRIAAMWATPLEAPPGMIPLEDPLVRLFGPGRLLTKDLFFSGHTSTLFLLALTVPGRGWKRLFVAATAAVAVSVLVQHVHYAIDVLAAPFFAYASVRVVSRRR